MYEEDEEGEDGDWGWFGNHEEELALPYMPPIESGSRKLSWDATFSTCPSEALLLE